jgi:hypothetical protein
MEPVQSQEVQNIEYKYLSSSVCTDFIHHIRSALQSRSLFLLCILSQTHSNSIFIPLPTSNMRFFEIAAAALTAASTAYGAPVEKRAAAIDELVGFAAGTTGGSGAGTTVSSCAELTAAAKVGGVIKVKGMLTGCGIIRVGTAGTSILGVGKDAGLTDSGLQVFKTSNIIIRNLKFYRAPKGKDLIDIEGSTKVWVDHNDFSSVGITGSKDTYDGLLDAKSGADFLTFSWNKFHDHVSLPSFFDQICILTTFTVEGLPSRSLRQQRRQRHRQTPCNLPPQLLHQRQLAPPLNPLRHRPHL